MKRTAKKDRILKFVAVLTALIAVAYVGYRLYTDNRTTNNNVSKVSESLVRPPEAEPGYAVYFSDLLKFGFTFPKEQDPLKANPEITNALESVLSKDFSINIYSGSEFRYQPWVNHPTTCVYDGALHAFSSTGSGECNFKATAPVEGTEFLASSFEKDGTIRHVYLSPALNRKYFVVFTADYVIDCNQQYSGAEEVCAARSEQKRIKLENFVRSIAVKNHEPFAREQ